MRISVNKSYFAACVVLASLGVLLAAAGTQEGPATGEQGKEHERLIPSVKGPDLFRAYCAPCHGGDGKGNGPAAPALNTKPPDLTLIARTHGGVFPAKRISNLIAGEDVVIAHGSRDMPVWGPIFHRVEWDRDLGEIRLRNVTKYLESIQQK